MFKLTIRYFVYCLAIFLITFPAYAYHYNQDRPDINILVDEKIIKLSVPPKMINSQLYIPVRDVCEALGLTADWRSDGHKSLVYFTSPSGKNVILEVGSMLMLENQPTYVKNYVSFVNNGKTYVPIRFISESFNCKVRYDSGQKTAYISKITMDREKVGTEDIAKMTNAVVAITTEEALGTGFFVSNNGYIITNYHVIEGANNISVTLNNDEVLMAEIAKLSPAYDLALLKVNTSNSYFKIAVEEPNIGENVVAIGNPLGLRNTVSTGLLSSIRNLDGIILYQTTVPISHGSSGGPLINMYGEVIGVNTATITDGQNLNFAIPYCYINEMLNNYINEMLNNS